MTKEDILNEIKKKPGIVKPTFLQTLKALMELVNASLSNDEIVYTTGREPS